ncbi:ABC transporter ATP-binding protein [Marinoscillum pacificum]|uniref:ABC transporter ATP-binding protein n=1 Tax=Marinoscillum pacificum TaxID=392723 RepID=UPI00215893EF|nr:ABC transporter ATP-binding protein [Marinoscillum pacificum]
MSAILEVSGLTKSFKSGVREITVLDNISFDLEEGKSMSIIGPSGSGKTTLLGLCAGLDRASQGSVSLDNIVLNKLTEDELAQLRNQEVGFIFQNFQLIPTLTALENVMVPLELRGEKNIAAFAKELLSRVGLGDRYDHYPSQLSGGEQQRVAIARAFANRPKILFADEPTGNLDEETSHSIEALLFEINKEQGTTLVIVTHDDALAHKTDRILKLKGGKIVS